MDKNIENSSLNNMCALSNIEKTEIKWTHETILFLLSEYQKRAQKFRNSQLKKKDLWQEISTAFDECLNILASVDAVDKKFRNMKQSYLQIKKKINTSRHGPIKWEYFEAFEEIFATDETINVGSSISSTFAEPSCLYSSNSMEAASNISLNEKDSSRKKITIQNSSTSCCKRLRKEREIGNEIEKQKLQKLNQISETLKETNVIFKDFLKIYKENSKRNKT